MRIEKSDRKGDWDKAKAEQKFSNQKFFWEKFIYLLQYNALISIHFLRKRETVYLYAFFLCFASFVSVHDTKHSYVCGFWSRIEFCLCWNFGRIYACYELVFSTSIRSEWIGCRVCYVVIDGVCNICFQCKRILSAHSRKHTHTQTWLINIVCGFYV